MDLDAKMRLLSKILLAPPPDPSVRTDSSIFVVYPPEAEIEFRSRLQNLLQQLEYGGVAFRHLDLTTLPFEVLEDSRRLPDAFTIEFEEYPALKRGLARDVQDALKERLIHAAGEVPNGVVILSGTCALYPMISFDVLNELRHLPCRIVLAMPGERKGGKIYFMGKRALSNYLAMVL